MDDLDSKKSSIMDEEVEYRPAYDSGAKIAKTRGFSQKLPQISAAVIGATSWKHNRTLNFCDGLVEIIVFPTFLQLLLDHFSAEPPWRGAPRRFRRCRY